MARPYMTCKEPSVRRSSPTPSLVAALFCLLGCDSDIPVFDQSDAGRSDAGRSDAGSADAGGADAGASDAGEDASTDPMWLAALATAEAFCEETARCSPRAFATMWYEGYTQCVRSTSFRVFDQRRRGAAAADPEACAEAAADLDCDGLPDGDVSEVCAPLPGPRSEGHACQWDFECGLTEAGARMHCEGSNGGCDGQCRPYLREGEECSEGRCDDGRGELCVPPVGGGAPVCTALPLVDDGESCERARCHQASTCDLETRVCVPRPRLGDVCHAPLDCLGGLDVVCNPHDDGGSRCQLMAAPIPAGSACSPGTTCAGDRPCPGSGRCPTSCVEGAGCAYGELCDDDAGRCEPGPFCRY